MIDQPCAPPVIPVRRASNRRRRSLPASATANLARRSANYVTVKPASPEVISSLISTLSAISTPIDRHLQALPTTSLSYSTTSLPTSCQADFPFSPHQENVYEPEPALSSKVELGTEHGIYHRHSSLGESTCLLKGDPDLGDLTMRSIPQSPPSHKTLKPRTCSADIEAQDDLGEICRIGTPSIEPAFRIPHSHKEPSRVGDQSSMQSFQNMDSPKSRERQQTIENYQVTANGGSPTILFSPNSKNSINGDDTYKCRSEEPYALSTPTFSDKEMLGAYTIELTHSPTNIPSPRRIPTRDSSLRHSFGGSTSHRKRRFRWSDRSESPEKPRYSFEYDFTSRAKGLSKESRDYAEDDVTRRITELKMQNGLNEFPTTIAVPESTLVNYSDDINDNLSPARIAETWLSQNSSVSQPESDKDNNPGAPSAAVVQSTIHTDSPRVSLVNSKPMALASSLSVEPVSEQSHAQSTVPQRSNSRLLKRLSRPSTPITTEKYRRTFSNALADDRPKSTDSVDDAVYEYISSPRLSQKITDPETGRVISFSEVGDPSGLAVFCCVGMGLTRYVTAFYDDLATTLKLRLITPDRPGIGASEVHTDGLDTPLGWPDDVRAICKHLKLTKFSLLAHSAGAIYALATALRMPQYIRGRVHLLAPWIPASQMTAIGAQKEALPTNPLPYSQRFLRSLPTPFLKAANSSFLSTTSASITTRLPKSPRRAKRHSINVQLLGESNDHKHEVSLSPKALSSELNEASISKEAVLLGGSRQKQESALLRISERERQLTYDTRLTEAIWSHATADANPAVDLLVCLERRQPIGFRYVDITRAVVIHHGSRDSRVPIENVKWLGKAMRKCEVRVLEGEGHGLMASAAVMGGVLMEIAKEWEDWMMLVRGKNGTNL